MNNLPRFEYEVDKLFDKNYLNVPRLPLPKLEDTLRRYLETVKPHATQEELENTTRLAEEFKHKHGAELHAELERRTKLEGFPYSYIEEFWDDMYLAGRFEVMVNSNPFYVIPREVVQPDQDQFSRAARFASCLLRWWGKVVTGQLEADMEGENPLCMYGYGLVFASTRVPAVGRDDLATNFNRKHILVLCNSHMFKLVARDENGASIGVYHLKEKLAAIKAVADSLPLNKTDLGLLTGQERDYWATLRSEIISSSTLNQQSLETVDDCLFVLSLDGENPNGDDEVTLSNQFLYGFDGANRWFDKHNIFATPNGSLGICFEHTFGDGLTWNRMLTEVWADMNHISSGFSPLPQANESFEGCFEKLEWELPTSILERFPDVKARAKTLTRDIQTYVLRFKSFGRDRIKEMKLSPDAFCQMAFQLGYYKLHGKPPAVYESCAMKNFFHGRTETIRSCTTDSLAMMKAFEGQNIDEMRRSLQKACQTHVKVAKGAKAAIGPYQGVDRHLYAMKCLAEKMGIDVPFFKDPLYSRSSTWVLSTSNVSAPFIHVVGFGPVCGHGYGLGYLVQPDHITVNITSFRSSSDTNSKRLGEAIEEALETISNLFTRSRL